MMVVDLSRPRGTDQQAEIPAVGVQPTMVKEKVVVPVVVVVVEVDVDVV